MFSDIIESIKIISRSAGLYYNAFYDEEMCVPDERLLDHIRIGVDMRRVFQKSLEEQHERLLGESELLESLARLREVNQAELNYWENTLERLERDSGEIRTFRRREFEGAIELAREDCERNLLKV